MKESSASEILLIALPVLLVLVALIGAIVFLPQGGALDIRGKAAPITVVPTKVAVPTARPTTRPAETVCPDLYKPVCATNTNKTYSSECEARLANDLPLKTGACTPTQ